MTRESETQRIRTLSSDSRYKKRARSPGRPRVNVVFESSIKPGGDKVRSIDRDKMQCWHGPHMESSHRI